MTDWGLVLRSLLHHWRSSLGIGLGVAVSAATLTGALIVGDSVRWTLERIAVARIGQVELAVSSGERLFRDALADEVGGLLESEVAPVLSLRGSASFPKKETRAHRVNVRGVDRRFWKLGAKGEAKDLPSDLEDAGIAINESLARRLEIVEGDELLLRIENPSALIRDAPLSTVDDFTISARARVAAVLPDDGFGRFDLSANQIAPLNAFCSLAWLQEQVDRAGRANMLLAAGSDESPLGWKAANEAIKNSWTLADANLELRTVPDKPAYELVTEGVFLDDTAARAGLGAASGAQGALTYFVNRISRDNRTVPYSMATAIDLDQEKLEPDECLVNEWTAANLEANPGDPIDLAYFVMGPKRSLVEATRTFTLKKILPMEGAALDPALMPAFPGLRDSENCRDWDPGFAMDVDLIRDEDEAYWDRYRGSPKVFLSLEAGQEMWDNRFGNLTTVRYPSSVGSMEDLGEAIREKLDPTRYGLFFTPVREQALAAGSQGMDFGGLFIGLSFFLIVSSLLLTGLFFVLGLQQRTRETGTLLALGFLPKQVRRLLLREGTILALIGGLVGAALGYGYAKVVLLALAKVWSGAIADARIDFHAAPSTFLTGAFAGMIVSYVTIRIVTRKQAAKPARALLSMGAEDEREDSARTGTSWRSVAVAVLCLVGAMGLLYSTRGAHGKEAAGAFFGAGAALLIAGLALSSTYLRWAANRPDRAAVPTLFGLGRANASRRRGRSLGVIGLLACGSFLVVAVGANRHDPTQGAERKESGTGGFALYAESTLPAYQDLNTEAGLNDFGLSHSDLANTAFMQVRLREGDDASCLNLNRAQTPKLLGVPYEALAERGCFTFAKTIEGTAKNQSPWSLLASEANDPDAPLPAIMDDATMMWALGKKLGDTLTYVDDRGEPFQVRIVATLANSILQGAVLVSEKGFVRKFPSRSGYRVFLIDAPRGRFEPIRKTLADGFQDLGMEVTPAVDRLIAFNQVENTYLSIFQSLGALGLLLGSVGLGVVVLRNALERRSEFALLKAVGFSARSIRKVAMSEHLVSLFLGLGIGAISGLVAAAPTILSASALVPYRSLGFTLVALFVSGLFWIGCSVRLALSGPLLEALRSE